MTYARARSAVRLRKCDLPAVQGTCPEIAKKEIKKIKFKRREAASASAVGHPHICSSATRSDCRDLLVSKLAVRSVATSLESWR